MGAYSKKQKCGEQGGRPKKKGRSGQSTKRSWKGKKREKKVKKVPTVYCTDMNDFVEKVGDLRGLPSLSNVLYKMYIDDGQKLLKVSLSIVEWMRQEDGKKGFKSGGVKKVFILACAPCKETYDNIRVMLDKIGIHHFHYDWRLSGDCKFLNVFCGLGPHSSTYPCHICTWRSGSDKPGEKRTFDDVRRNFASMKECGGAPKDFYRLLICLCFLVACLATL